MIGELLSGAWEKYKESWQEYVVLVFIGAVLGAILFAVAALPTMTQAFSGKVDLMQLDGTFILVSILVFLVVVWIDTAILLVADKKRPAFQALGDVKNVFVNRIIADIILMVVAGLPGIVGLVAAGLLALYGAGALGTIVLLLGVAVTVYLFIRLFWTEYNVVIKGKGAVEGLKDSWSITEKDMWPVVYTIIAIIILGIIDFAVQVIPLIGFLVSLFAIKPMSRALYVIAGKKLAK